MTTTPGMPSRLPCERRMSTSRRSSTSCQGNSELLISEANQLNAEQWDQVFPAPSGEPGLHRQPAQRSSLSTRTIICKRSIPGTSSGTFHQITVTHSLGPGPPMPTQTIIFTLQTKCTAVKYPFEQLWAMLAETF